LRVRDFQFMQPGESMTREQWMWMQASVALLAAAAAQMRSADQAPAVLQPGARP
jgi:hypothetical protein